MRPLPPNAPQGCVADAPALREPLSASGSRSAEGIPRRGVPANE